MDNDSSVRGRGEGRFFFFFFVIFSKRETSICSFAYSSLLFSSFFAINVTLDEKKNREREEGEEGFI